MFYSFSYHCGEDFLNVTKNTYIKGQRAPSPKEAYDYHMCMATVLDGYITKVLLDYRRIITQSINVRQGTDSLICHLA
jgi:hypothetical protein